MKDLAQPAQSLSNVFAKQPSPTSPEYQGARMSLEGALIDAAQYRSDLMSTINEIVNVTNARYGIRLEPTIEQMCAILADVDPAELPKCESCETAFALIPCKGCKYFFCPDCRHDHVCGGGPNATEGRF